MRSGHHLTIHTNQQFEEEYRDKVRALLKTEPFNRGNAHAMKDDTTSQTHELMHVQEHFYVDTEPAAWAVTVNPNLPWAEDHFQERVSGQPLNPPPSEQHWPFARAGNAEHKKNETFSHSYPERYWPRFANEGGKMAHSERIVATPIVGIRFEYGDLMDLVKVLHQNPNSRQAYLPVWFPEDLTAARLGERVPCSMGYHFIYDPTHDGLDCVYTMRSCDIVRFYRDDVYMAGRLLQWVAHTVDIRPGTLVINIANLHCFPGDVPFLTQHLPLMDRDLDKRTSYNFDALG